MEDFRQLVKKPFSTFEAYIDYKADHDTNNIQSINKYRSKWGWDSRSKVQRWLHKFKAKTEAFNSAVQAHNNAKIAKNTKSGTNDTPTAPILGDKTGVSDTLSTDAENPSKNGKNSDTPTDTPTIPILGGKTGVSDTPTDTHKKEYRKLSQKEPVSHKGSFSKKEILISPISREGQAELTLQERGKNKNLFKSKEQEQTTMPDGYWFYNPSDFIGTACNSNFIEYENIVDDVVIYQDGKLKRNVIFLDGSGVGSFLSTHDALAIFKAYRQMNKPTDTFDKELEEAVSTFEKTLSTSAQEQTPPPVAGTTDSPLDRALRLAKNKRMNISAGNDTEF